MPDAKYIRWKLCYFKLCKILGIYSVLEKGEKKKVVNYIIQTYLQGHSLKEEELTDNDLNNLDDSIIIAVELLNEIKLYDLSVLNPINFMIISLLEFALKKSPQNKTFSAWLLKLYSKLGLTNLVSDISKGI